MATHGSERLADKLGHLTVGLGHAHVRELAVALAHHLQQSKTDTFGSARQGTVRAVRRGACGGSGRERRVRGSEECGACEATEPENEAIVVPRHSTPATSRSTLLRRPNCEEGRLTWEEHGCGEELIEAPIVDPWVTILNQVHLDVSRRQRRRRHLTWHATVEPWAEASGCGSQCCCARAERCARS